MGLYNRLSKQNQPANWDDIHNTQTTPDKNIDWYKWGIAVHPFTDLMGLYVMGDLGVGAAALDKAQALFDLSATERTQFVEMYQGFINPGGSLTADEQMNNVTRLQSIIRAIERQIPQQFVGDLQVWLYGKLGITTADDR